MGLTVASSCSQPNPRGMECVLLRVSLHCKRTLAKVRARDGAPPSPRTTRGSLERRGQLYPCDGLAAEAVRFEMPVGNVLISAFHSHARNPVEMPIPCDLFPGFSRTALMEEGTRVIGGSRRPSIGRAVCIST